MSRRKKKKHHEEEVGEAWLLPYADILTLLLALFIVLFSMSSIDAAKFAAMSAAFSENLSGGTGILNFPSPTQENGELSPDEQEKREKEENEVNDQVAAEKVEKLELQTIQQKVNTYIQTENLGDMLETSLTDEGLLLTIRDNVLFASGSADVRPQDLQVANEIAELLVMDPPRNIIISGHTDNVPISNPRFESNWELSVMRAINFMKIILKNENLDPSWFSAKGFGEFEPIASNDSEEGRSKNRRVEVLILPRSSN